MPLHNHGVTSQTSHNHTGYTGTGYPVCYENETGKIVKKDSVRYSITTHTVSHYHTITFENTSHSHTCHYAGYGYGTDMSNSSYHQCSSKKNGGIANAHSNMGPSKYFWFLIKY